MVENKVLSIEETNRALKRKSTRSKAGRIIAMAVVYFVLLLVYAPILYITVFSFTAATTTGMWSGFSLKSFAGLFDGLNPDGVAIWNAALNTMLVAVTSATLSVLLGTLGAIGIYYDPQTGENKRTSFQP